MYETHGLSRHPQYSTWKAMRRRCENPDDVAYPNYGARGIRVCDEWRQDVAAFVSYVEKVLGPRPEGLTLDRIDNDGHYEPGNLRWATKAEQTHNRRRLPTGRLGYTGVCRHSSRVPRWEARYHDRGPGVYT